MGQWHAKTASARAVTESVSCLEIIKKELGWRNRASWRRNSLPGSFNFHGVLKAPRRWEDADQHGRDCRRPGRASRRTIRWCRTASPHINAFPLMRQGRYAASAIFDNGYTAIDGPHSMHRGTWNPPGRAKLLRGRSCVSKWCGGRFWPILALLHRTVGSAVPEPCGPHGQAAERTNGTGTPPSHR